LAAKWWAARAGHRVSHAVQHVHGGLGADVEYPIHAFFLRATQLSIALGGSTPVLARIGARLAAGSVAPFT
jgi:alkylation response protein AidB-like acyl-CoA dehydrogenase